MLGTILGIVIVGLFWQPILFGLMVLLDIWPIFLIALIPAFLMLAGTALIIAINRIRK